MSVDVAIREAVDWTTVDWSTDLHDIKVDRRSIRVLDKGSGPPLLLVHGTGGAWQSWLLNLDDLTRGHRVIAVDLPGFGASSPVGRWPDVSPYSDALVDVLDGLGVDRATVLGHSLGGVMAMRFALDHADRTTSLVLVDGGGVDLTPLRLRLVVTMLLAMNAVLSRAAVVRAIIGRPRLRRLVMSGFTRNPQVATGPLASEFISTFAAPGLVDAVRSGARDPIGGQAARIAAPTLLIWGQEDPLVPLAVGEKLRDEIPGARLEVIAGARHCPMLEDPPTFAHLVGAWLEEHGTA